MEYIFIMYHSRKFIFGMSSVTVDIGGFFLDKKTDLILDVFEWIYMYLPPFAIPS